MEEKKCEDDIPDQEKQIDLYSGKTNQNKITHSPQKNTTKQPAYEKSFEAEEIQGQWISKVS